MNKQNNVNEQWQKSYISNFAIALNGAIVALNNELIFCKLEKRSVYKGRFLKGINLTKYTITNGVVEILQPSNMINKLYDIDIFVSVKKRTIYMYCAGTGDKLPDDVFNYLMHMFKQSYKYKDYTYTMDIPHGCRWYNNHRKR